MAKRDHSYSSGRIHRASSSQAQQQGRRAPQPAGGVPATAKKPRKSRGKKVLVALALFLALLLAAVFVLYNYVGSFLDTGELGTIGSAFNTPKEYKGDVINILLVGVDYEEGRDHALTDMIMYINFDIKNNQMNMLQIPRDSFVGYDYSSDGKINAAMTTGDDQTNPINNLVKIVTEQYQLPVDRYIALDMDSMKAIVNTFGGLYVYVPKTMSYGGSYLEQGWRWLDGDAAEFFVRNRKGEGMERADLDRLENQRYFYSALFRRFLNLTVEDIVKLLPVVEYYVTTDIKTSDLTSLAVSALKLEAESILLAKAPGATSVSGYDGYYVIDIYGRGTEEEPGLANILNTYFRTYGEQVSADTLASGSMPYVNLSGYTLYDAAIQRMGEIQETEGGSDIDVEPTA